MNITNDDKPYGQLTKEQIEQRIKIDSEILANRLKEVSTENITPVNITRPNYYGGENNTYEVFKVLEAWGVDKDFYLGNVIKYISRAGKKDSSKTKEDLEKALVYLQRRISSL